MLTGKTPLPWPGRSPFGAMAQMRADLLGVVMRAAYSVGDVVDLGLPGVRVVVVNSPAIVDLIFVSQANQFTRQTRAYAQLRRVLGNGLLTSDAPFWKRQRRLAQPAFHKERISAMSTGMITCAKQLLESWQPRIERQEPIDLYVELKLVTMRIIAEALLSVDVSQNQVFNDALTDGFAATRIALRQPIALPTWFPTPNNRASVRSRKALDAVLLELITARRAGQVANDLLSMFMSAVDAETDAQMTDRELLDEVMTMFIAGHETTTVLTTWALYLLSTSPAVARRAREELAAVLGGRDPVFEDLARLPFLNAIFSEVLRLYPPAWLLSRQVTETCVLDGWLFKKGTAVLMSPYALHRRPSTFENPEGFDPDRWADLGRLPKGAYVPFGAGGHKCIGDSFAQLEFTTLLATLLPRVSFELVPGQNVTPRALITLRPHDGLKMRVQPVTD